MHQDGILLQFQNVLPLFAAHTTNSAILIEALDKNFELVMADTLSFAYFRSIINSSLAILYSNWGLKDSHWLWDCQ